MVCWLNGNDSLNMFRRQTKLFSVTSWICFFRQLCVVLHWSKLCKKKYCHSHWETFAWATLITNTLLGKALYIWNFLPTLPSGWPRRRLGKLAACDRGKLLCYHGERRHRFAPPLYSCCHRCSGLDGSSTGRGTHTGSLEHNSERSWVEMNDTHTFGLMD